MLMIGLAPKFVNLLRHGWLSAVPDGAIYAAISNT